MARSFTLSLLSATLVCALLGCDPTVLVYSSNDPPQDQQNYGEDPHDHHPHEDEHGHGPEPEDLALEVSPLSGSWRVARAEDDMPLAYFEIFLNADEVDTGSGVFRMGPAPQPNLDGNRGDTTLVRFQNNRLTLQWNPTAQASERYEISADVPSAEQNRFSGTFRTEQAPYEFEVVLTRQNPR